MAGVAQPPDGIRGREVNHTWFDEVAPVAADALRHMGVNRRMLRPKPLRAIDVPCPFCEVSAGVACKRIRLHVNWSNAHAERRETARLVTNARDALTD